MNEIAIIIPARLDAKRLPNKPLKLINNKEMILHVRDSAQKLNIGTAYVTTPDQPIIKLINEYGGKAILTSPDHQTGTDRIFEVFKKHLKEKPDIIINLQGDMPNISSDSILSLINYMKKSNCDIDTLASKLNIKKEEKDPNVVKVETKKNLKDNRFSQALDFFRTKKNPINDKTYHHIGIYGFTNKALIRYVSLERSKLELERKLEQLRALENKIKIEVGFVKNSPLSVDTLQDLEAVRKQMEN